LTTKYDVFVIPQSYVRMMLGTGFHYALGFEDIEVGRTFDGIEVSGKVDYFKDGVLVDFKTTAKMPPYP
jgi:hypothetical protein